MDQLLFWLVPAASVLALGFAWHFHRQMMKESEGTPQMIKIAAAVRKGAMSYLKQQYKIVGLVFLALVVLFSVMAYGFDVQNHWVPVAFLTGGFFSGLSGFLGMKTATYASARTANAARTSLNGGLHIAFRSGAVMGLVVVGLGLLDISFWYLLLNAVIPAEALTPTHKLCVITTTMLTFGMGASTQALFARVGGGIYTKAADVGADLVGKVEAGIPEDDPRNPATIADNVGDNVGDVAGMGADLYESYCGSILATAALGAAAFIHSGDTLMQYKAVIAPMLIAAVGIVLSIIGIFSVRTKENATMKDLLGALGFGTNLSSVLIVVATFFILWLLKLDNWMWISCSVVVGLLVGIVIGRSTEYYTSQSYKPTRRLSESGKTGPATVIISGIGLGMLSTAVPVIAVVVGIIASYLFASGFDFNNVGLGLYGIGIAAVGMLSTLGITLATDAYGPIADNAGGNAEMSGLGAEVRKRTDALDSLGNTTAATGKGFAIGSAALTGLALLASYVEEIRIGLTRLGTTEINVGGTTVPLQDATFFDFMHHYDVTLMNPKVLSGMFIGSMMAFLFCGLTMNAVGRAAAHMVDEVRRQFREIKGILTGETEPDYARCVSISTKGAQREMVVPSLIAIVAPILTGIVFGVPGVLGLLIGGLSSGFVLAIFMANSGGAWDNAKKYVEEGNFGGKGSEVHKATVVGDTVGDPFKDTSGPSLNILIKLMSMVAIVMAGLTVAWSVF
ncbi:sodium-translocating pyrophosphatase [Mediterranea massiliensis]|uniref:sodium-translocating pyrophosphatase n=1 Tax=Mediterranea massiliensis TaxID=1841865 RepID=UPI0025A450AC|nr:sodium-translocating pyrophosphatase [Mediterranea massiliensis]MDM8338266.1 sodium-translocating pyrophosphatase [Mediterranea massiliensis]